MSKGSLIIAGGAIRDSALVIFAEFVRLAGGSNRRFAVLPCATARPEAGLADFTAFMSALGVAANQISLLEVSPTVEGWQSGASDPAVLDLAQAADGIWMLGGNQNNIIKSLINADGSDSPLAALMRQRLAAGAVIGGTSAGAAVMSRLMIGGGTSYGSLALPRGQAEADTEVSDALFVTPGLGFFPAGMVDQHFDARARLGRLLEAALVEGGGCLPAFGVAEDTAMVWNAEANTVTAIGRGGVYVLEVQHALCDQVAGVRRIRNTRLHYLTRGDSFNIDNGTCVFSGKQRLSVADTQFTVVGPEASGCFSAYGQLADFISNYLLDNDPAGLFVDPADGSRYVRSYLWGQAGADSSTPDCRVGWELRFSRAENSTELWHGGVYGFRNVGVSLIPASLQIKTLE